MVVKIKSQEAITQIYVPTIPSAPRTMQHASPPRPSRAKRVADNRDVSHSTEISENEREASDSRFISADADSDSSYGDKMNNAVIEMEAGLEVQLKIKGRHHSCITRSQHALALEYKSQGRYEKAAFYIKEAQEILDERLALLVAEVEDENESSPDDPDRDLPKRTDGLQYDIIKTHASNVTKRYFAHLVEEKSVMYSCLANMYKKRGMYKEAMDNYVNSINMLVEADYPGDSPRVTMMVRLLKRTEAERKSNPIRSPATRSSKCDGFERS